MIFRVHSVVKVSLATAGAARPAVVDGGRARAAKYSEVVASSVVACRANSVAASCPLPLTIAITPPHSIACGVSPAVSTGRSIGCMASASVLSLDWAEVTPLPMIASS
ncbi:hypothetical protein SGRI78S_03032 [Streptomyces griseus subsp. griseus]